MSSTFFQIYWIFSEQEELQYSIIINYDTSFLSGMYKLKDSLLFDGIICNNTFLSVIISREHLKRSICQDHCVYFATHLANSTIASGLGWFEKIWRILCLFEENNCSPAPLSNFCFHPSHSFIVNMLIWKIHNSS